jgi:uncharacterized repeat protein (TIGR03899 family)
MRLLGKAEAEAEADKQRTLARAEADRKLILAAADEEIAERVIRREWARKLQEQRNLDTIVTQAALLAESAARASDAASEDGGTIGTADVDPDWLTRFIDLAKGVSASDMQRLCALLLSREVAAPGCFSVRSLEALKGMTQSDTDDFSALCQLVTLDSSYKDARLITGFTTELKEDRPVFFALRFLRRREIELELYGLPAVRLLNLQHSGLLYQDSLILRVRDTMDLNVAGSLVRITARSKRPAALTLLRLTPVGGELVRLVPKEPQPDYVTALTRVLSEVFDVTSA